MNLARLSALRIGRLYTSPGDIPGIHFCQRPQCDRRE